MSTVSGSGGTTCVIRMQMGIDTKLSHAETEWEKQY